MKYKLVKVVLSKRIASIVTNLVSWGSLFNLLLVLDNAKISFLFFKYRQDVPFLNKLLANLYISTYLNLMARILESGLSIILD